MHLISTVNLNKKYQDLHILKNININIKKGEIVAIVGPSGAGKTTLLQLLGTLDKPTSGEVIFDTVQLQYSDDAKLSNFRNEHLGFVFQFHQLLPEFNVLENVCLPAWIQNKRSKDEIQKEATQILDRLGLKSRLMHKPAELSGGEQQRTAVARALINKPKVIFADEPSGNLDSLIAGQLHQLFFDLRDTIGQTFVIVTHNEELANACDRKITLRDGEIVN